MSRSSALLKNLLPRLQEDLESGLEADEYYSKDIVDELCEDVLQQCAAAVAEFKRLHNAAHQCARFPPEIWCLIWSFLPVGGLITVTHVCRSWRSIALGYPPLWNNVSFSTTVHARGLDCDNGLCECPDHLEKSTHNLQQVETWLHRSKNAPITMEVNVYPVFSEQSLAIQLAKIVQPHASRLTALSCYFGDASFLIHFMQHIGEFSSLELLRMRRITNYGELNTWPMTKVLERLTIPKLREFRGREDFWWDIPNPPGARFLPTLRHLRCVFRDPRCFYHCLRACPNLVFLNSELDPGLEDHPTIDSDFSDIPEDASHLARHMQVLILDRIVPCWEPLIRPILRRPTLETQTLRYISFDPRTVFQPLRDLGDGIQLHILGDAYAIELDAKDENSRLRSLQLDLIGEDEIRPIPALSHLWTHVHVQNLYSLKLSWPWRAILLHTSIVAPRVSRIDLVVQISDHGTRLGIPDLMALVDSTDAGRPSFPNLRVLGIAARDYGASASGRRIEYLSALSVSALSVQEFAKAISDHALSIEIAGVELMAQPLVSQNN